MYQRLCDCQNSKAFQKGKAGARPKLSCLSAKDWLKSMMIVREFFYTKQDIRDKAIHPSMYPVQLPEFFIKLFTHKGELVVDPFAGLNTTGVAARNLNRDCASFEIEKRYVMAAHKRLKGIKNKGSCEQKIFLMNALDKNQLVKHLEPNSIKLVVTSPPYFDILTRLRENKSRRTEDRKLDKHHPGEALQPMTEGNIGAIGTIPETWAMYVVGAINELYPYMYPWGHIVLNVSDIYRNRQRVLLTDYIKREMMGNEDIVNDRWLLKNIFVWDKRNLINQAGIFGYPSNFITMSVSSEYILHFEVRK